MHSPALHERRRGRAAFTLVELLVVIVVIGVVMSLLLLVGGRVLDSQKRNATRNTMRLTEMAIEQFRNVNPLQDVYDNPKLRDPGGNAIGRTFGPYAPYTLSSQVQGSVANALEPADYAIAAGLNPGLGARLSRDLSGERPAPAEPNLWVDVEQGNQNDDIRALYAYMAAYAPGVVAQIPESAKKRLPDRAPGDLSEIVNPSGTGTNPPGDGALDVFGIYDAWGVPLDYFLQVKLEHKIGPDGATTQWVVTDRVPVLRSRGIPLEQAQVTDQAFLTSGDESLWQDEQKNWIFSQAFPQPAFKRDRLDRLTGEISGSAVANDGGWVRLRAQGDPANERTRDSYDYVPQTGP